MFDFITLTDGYKLGHKDQYPPNTQYVMSNLTARSSRILGVDHVVWFGAQYFLQRYLGEVANRTFFSRPRGEVLDKYQRLIDGYLGPNQIGTEHIAALHKLRYIPLEFRALPEGSHVPLRVPMMVWENTHPDFFWVTNYIETLLSTCLWLPCTSATTALRYRQLLDAQARETGGDPAFVDWQAHDFSMRGMEFPEASALSGLGHLLSFTGTDCLPALQIANDYYYHKGVAGGSVAATEHAVMCAGGKENEAETFARLLTLYPTGIVSVVSDSWDLWEVITKILPALKDRIMARNGKLTIRPDSGDPVDILCGVPTGEHVSSAAERRGVVGLLWDIFGGTTNAAGFKELDPHIGAIYGDSITVDRAHVICRRLADKGFASTNVVLGVGSYSYQYVTRDTYGFAVKATWAQIDGKEHMLYKDPVTDNGVKRSARGRIVVRRDESGKYYMRDGLNKSQEALIGQYNQLTPIWRDGKFLRRADLTEIRQTLRGST